MKFLQRASWIVLLVAMSGCDKTPPPVVVLDQHWNEEFTKNFCEGVNAAPSFFDPPARVACTNDLTARVDLFTFEGMLKTELATSPECKGVQIVFQERQGRELDWLLRLNYVPGNSTQEWNLFRQPDQSMLRGEGTPKEIAAKVCAIVSQRGAVLGK